MEYDSNSFDGYMQFGSGLAPVFDGVCRRECPAFRGKQEICPSVYLQPLFLPLLRMMSIIAGINKV